MNYGLPPNTLVVMAKSPVPGLVKTRLCPPLNPATAVRLHECFLLDTIAKGRMINNTHLVLSYWPTDGVSMLGEAAHRADSLMLQDGSDIGERMLNCFQSLCNSATPVVLLGTDTPTLSVRIIRDAFSILASDSADVVVGPAVDGGYYLIGMKTAYPALFEGIEWSTGNVLLQTIERAVGLGVHLHLLPYWYDVDTPKDLSQLANGFHGNPKAVNSAPRTSRFMEGLIEDGLLCRIA